jgi:hypothetical protein
MTPSFMGGETMSTQAAAQHEHAADPYGHAARPSMDEERIQMVVDYYKATDTPHVLRLYAMSDHSAEAYEAFRRLLTERQVAIPPPSGRPRQSSSRRQQPVALVRARVLLGIAALASLDWRTAVVALVAAGASWRRSERCQQGAVLGTVLFLVMTGVVVGKGMLLVAHHDTPAWMSGISTVLLRHGGVSFVLAGWACVSLWRLRGLRPT